MANEKVVGATNLDNQRWRQAFLAAFGAGNTWMVKKQAVGVWRLYVRTVVYITLLRDSFYERYVRIQHTYAATALATANSF